MPREVSTIPTARKRWQSRAISTRLKPHEGCYGLVLNLQGAICSKEPISELRRVHTRRGRPKYEAPIPNLSLSAQLEGGIRHSPSSLMPNRVRSRSICRNRLRWRSMRYAASSTESESAKIAAILAVADRVASRSPSLSARGDSPISRSSRHPSRSAHWSRCVPDQHDRPDGILDKLNEPSRVVSSPALPSTRWTSALAARVRRGVVMTITD